MPSSLTRKLVILAVAAAAGSACAQSAVQDKRAPAARDNAAAACTGKLLSSPGLRAGKFRPDHVPQIDRPAKGEWFRDPVYGSCVVRVTDHQHEPPQGFARNDYSRRQPFNADGSLLLVYAQDGYWHLYDADSLEHVRKLNLGGGSVEPQWHPQDPDLLFVLPNNGGMELMQVDVTTGRRTTFVDFTERMNVAGRDKPIRLTDIWPSVARLWTRSEGSPSMDARFWAFLAETQDFKPLGMISYDAKEKRIIGVYDFAKDGDGIGRPDHLSMSPKGNHVVVSWNGKDVDCPSRWLLGSVSEPCGLMSFTSDFRHAEGLAARGPHSDIALDAKGNEVIVVSNYDTGDLEMISLDDGDVTVLWEIYENGHATALHVSGKAYRKPGWVLVSTYADRGPDDVTPWYVDKLMAVELAEDPRILNIANTFNDGSGYFSEPHAVVNRDFTRVVYNSNWGTGHDSDIDVYLVRLPSDVLSMHDSVADISHPQQSAATSAAAE